jgi:hypothetical protein
MDEGTAVVELWLPVVGWDGYYEVSNQGRVRSVDRVVPHGLHDSTRAIKGRILVGIPDRHGYPHVNLSRNGRSSLRPVHQLVLEAFVGPRPPNCESCHNNGVPSDARSVNLRWGTRSDNVLDIVKHGNNANSNKIEGVCGHLLAEPNLVGWHAREGHRGCLACARARSHVWYVASCGRVLDFQAVADQYYRAIMKETS